MDTITQKKCTRKNIARRAATVSTAIAAVTFLPIASATFAVNPTLPVDPSGGAYGDAWGTFQTWALAAIPALFGLTVLGLGIRMLLKWTKRAGRAL